MKTKQVTRYQCDFCGKKGYAASPMAKHEKHCTMNPARECRVCKMLEHTQPNLGSLIVLLPDPFVYVRKRRWEPGEPEAGWEYILAKTNEALPKLREAAGDCPACIMAALRIREIPVPMVMEFNFTEEMRAIWEDINERKMAHDEQYV